MRHCPSPLGYLSSREYLTEFDGWASANLKMYSRRAFARWAGIASSNFMTLIVSGSRPLHGGWLPGFAKAAKLTAEESRYLKTLVQFEQAKTDAEKTERHRKLKELIFATKISFLQKKELYLLSSPDIWAIYIALNLETSEPDQAVGIRNSFRERLSLAYVRAVLNKFVKLDLVEKMAQGNFLPKYKFISTENEFSRIENRNFHAFVLQEAAAALVRVPIHERSFGSLTIVLDKEELSSIKKDIQDFGQSLLAKYGEKKKLPKDQLARLNLQLYPLTKEI